MWCPRESRKSPPPPSGAGRGVLMWCLQGVPAGPTGCVTRSHSQSGRQEPAGMRETAPCSLRVPDIRVPGSSSHWGARRLPSLKRTHRAAAS